MLNASLPHVIHICHRFHLVLKITVFSWNINIWQRLCHVCGNSRIILCKQRVKVILLWLVALIFTIRNEETLG